MSKQWWQFWKNEGDTAMIDFIEDVIDDLNPEESIEKSYALKPHDLSNMMILDGGGGPGYFFDDANDRQFDYATLDKLSRHSIASAIVQTRINQVSEFANPTEENSQDPIGFRIKKRDGSLPTEDEHKRIKELERFVSDCGSEVLDFELTFESFLRQIIRDSLVYDQCNFEIVKNKKGDVIGFLPVDASTIRRAKSGKKLGASLDEEIKYVQIYNNKIICEYKQDEMCFGVRRPRTSLGVKKYGFPELEELYQILNHIYNAEVFNAANFTNGISAAGIIAVKSKMNPKLFRAFRREFYQMLTGANNSKKTPLIQLDPDANEDLKALNLSSSNAEMEYSQWINYLIKVTCAIYQMDPAEIGFVFGNESQRSTAVQSDPSTRVLMGKEKGLRPLLRATQTWINKYVIYQIDPEYTLEFIGMDAISALDKQRINKGRSLYMTINELRALSGLKEIQDGDIIADAYTKVKVAEIKEEGEIIDDQSAKSLDDDYEDDAYDYFDFETLDNIDKKKSDKQSNPGNRLTDEEKEERDKESERRSKLDKPVYKPLPGDDKVKTKPSKYTRSKLAEAVREEMKKAGKDEFIRACSKVSGVSKKIIEKVYDRGLAAWSVSHRPGATPQQWAKARCYSFLTGGKTQKTADKDLWDEHLESKKSLYKAQTYVAPQNVADVAQSAIDAKEKFGDKVKGGTQIGWTRARQLADRKPMSYDTIKRMKAFFDRHEKNKEVHPDHKDFPWADRGFTAWKIWGGDLGRVWAEKIIDKVKKEEESK